MARILLAWELGANLGHVTPLRLLAQRLVAEGHHCTFALRDLAAAESAIDPALGAVHQAPVSVSVPRNPVRTQVSYSGLLHNSGFDDIVGLAARLRAWRELLTTLRCDRLVADHAPTALLAARALGVPALHIGTGFTVPPVRTPFVSFQPEATIPHEVLADNDAKVLQVVNGALARLGLTPLARLPDLFDGAAAAVLSYPELDHYGIARSEPYLGLPDFSRGARPVWPQPRAPRVFAYLRPSPGLASVLGALKASKAHVLVRIADAPASRYSSFARPNLLIVEEPVHLRLAAESCDVFINYGAHGTTAEMLLAGKPGWLLPTNLERTLVARRAVQLGAAIVTPPDEAPDRKTDPAEMLERLIEDPAPAAAARGFAQRHPPAHRAAIIERVATLATSGLA